MGLGIDRSARLRALVVDGDVENATALSCVLQIAGCKAAVAFGASMATTVAKLLQPTLVLLVEGVLNGSERELVQALRALGGPLSNALFVCLAGKDGDQQAQRWLAAGCDHVVCKPLPSHLLADLLAQAQAEVEVQSYRARDGDSQTSRLSGAHGRPAPA